MVSIKLKGTENYQVWSCAMLLALEGKNKTGFIDGSCKRSNTDEVLGRQWDRVNAVVLGWILNSISEELFLGQIFSKRAKHVWEELKETYDKVDGSIIFDLHHQIHTLKKNGSSIADYYHKLNALWKQFDAMIELPRCVCNASEDFKKHNQLMKLMQFLMGLDDSYMLIRSSILSREVLPDVRSAYATISSEESHRVASSSVSSSTQRSQASTFVSNVPNRNNFQRNNQNFSNGPRPNNLNNNRQSGGSSLVCENYGFNGHTIDRCFKIIGYPADFEKKILINLLMGKIFLIIILLELVHLLDLQMNKWLLLFLSSKKNKIRKNVQANMAWANQHMTYTDKELDNILDISHLKIKVGHPSGTEDFIYKIENLKLSNGLTLYDVLVIPEYCVTLISVHKLAKENKVVVAFDENKLGHPADPVLNVLKKSLQFDNNDKNLYYEICQRAKQTREPFALSDHVSSSLGELVHLNLWAPYKVTSFEGFRLSSSVLNGKSPYEMIYKKCPTLSHLRVFGCLCFATIVNNSDKFGSRYEKCVMIGVLVAALLSLVETLSLLIFQLILKNDADSNDNVFATQDERVTTIKENIFSEGNLDQNPNSSPHGVQNLRRSYRQSVFSRNYNDFVVDSKVKYGIEKYVGYSKLNTENYCFVTQLNKNHEPNSFLEASKYPHWTDSMNQEMNALLRNETWEIVELPKGRKVIGSKWIYKIKYQSSGEIDRFKARLMAQDLEETVYMKPPEGYFPSDNKVCRLKKSLYGLKQTPRQWNVKLTSTLMENGFIQSKSDYSLKSTGIWSNVYVDDIIITGNSVSETEKFKVNLKLKYVLDLLSEYGMLACKPAKTPLMSKLVVSNEACEKDPLLDNITDYQKLMRKMIYLINTRPDISYDVHCFSQFMHSPLKSHLKIAFKILRYLKSCPGLGIHIVKTSGMSLNAYTDADWANKKQNTLSKSSTKAGYRALASVTCEVIWILKILKDLNIENVSPVSLHCDSVVKTIKIDSAKQIADILTKRLDTLQDKVLVEKLGQQSEWATQSPSKPLKPNQIIPDQASYSSPKGSQGSERAMKFQTAMRRQPSKQQSADFISEIYMTVRVDIERAPYPNGSDGSGRAHYINPKEDKTLDSIKRDTSLNRWTITNTYATSLSRELRSDVSKEY
ncbi:ribonuclease H-like domain-containing protein [Tanacetum coccineum]|uniref:Ribonuclease H-like domain-containing protein n=1 Tax=Tanacetum coccineum TaxID=301880 RepID=A0ABQ5AA19_9ASTR